MDADTIAFDARRSPAARTAPKPRVPFIMSAARSGSTWLGKVFDSHPDVVYLHEPDVVDRGYDKLPVWFESAPNASQIEAAGAYVDGLLAARSPRATGTRPHFAKHYRGPMSDAGRRGVIYAAKALERAGLRKHAQRIYVPDFAAAGRPKRIVVKSVSALGRAEAIVKARGDVLYPILLVRHPCAYVASQLRGMALGVMEADAPPGPLLNTRAARRLGVREKVMAAKDEAEKIAWNWLLMNAEAFAAIGALGGTPVFYETLMQDPLGEVKRLFAAVDLSWARETEEFLSRSWEQNGSYYSVFRNPETSVNRWRSELDDDTIARIAAITARDPIGELALRGTGELRLAG
jgi:hypothetical protein